MKKLNVAKFDRVSRRRPPGDMAQPKTAIPRQRKGVKAVRERVDKRARETACGQAVARMCRVSCVCVCVPRALGVAL